MMAGRFFRPTDVVHPLADDSPSVEPDPIAEAEAAATEMDWSFDDAELTMQLRAVHRGRGLALTALFGSVFAIVIGIAIVL